MFLLKNILLPLLVLAFTALAVTFLQPIFTLKVRWVILAIVLTLTCFQGSFSMPLRTSVGTLSMASAIWCFVTVAWSEAWELSLLKSVACTLVMMTALPIGQSWVHQHRQSQTFYFLVPLALVTAFAAVFGRYSDLAYDGDQNIRLYQGMVSGPNMMGLMIAMCSPLLIWNVYRQWGRPQGRVVSLSILAIFVVFLIMTRSRSSVLLMTSVLVGLFLALHPQKRNQIIFGGVVSIGLMFLSQTLLESVGTFIRKSNVEEASIWATRADVWKDSLELAQQGGLLGAGYGVTIGETKQRGFTWGFSATGLGREKGNSQFAILEETGVIGLVLYITLMLTLALYLKQSYTRMPCTDSRVLMGMVGGSIFGLFLHSCVEAWWVAPGSPEFLYFWVMIGVAIGLSTDPRLSLRQLVKV